MPTKLTVDIALHEEDLRRDPILLEIIGLGEFEFPGVMNSLATVRVARWSAAGRTDDLSLPEMVSLLGDLVPDDILTEWSRRGFDLFSPDNAEAVEKIISTLLAEYQRRADQTALEYGEGKAQTTERSTPTTPPPFTGSGPT